MAIVISTSSNYVFLFHSDFIHAAIFTGENVDSHTIEFTGRNVGKMICTEGVFQRADHSKNEFKMIVNKMRALPPFFLNELLDLFLFFKICSCCEDNWWQAF